MHGAVRPRRQTSAPVSATSADTLLLSDESTSTSSGVMGSAGTRSGKTLASMLGHSDVVTSVVFSKDGAFLLSGSLDGTPRFVLVLFPGFLPVGEVLRRRKTLALVYATAGLGLAALLLYRFVHWSIVA